MMRGSEHGEENVAIYDHDRGRLTRLVDFHEGSIFKEENWK